MCWNWCHVGGEERHFLESFVTAVVLDVYGDGPVAGMVNCGRPPPLLLHKGEIAARLSGAPEPPRLRPPSSRSTPSPP
ncbi:hypothetical protein Z951_28175 [Streptomyces sp. PRh5]|nr:hypothetical protein Z951_28175 [Streptomyces sp. PRh5]